MVRYWNCEIKNRSPGRIGVDLQKALSGFTYSCLAVNAASIRKPDLAVNAAPIRKPDAKGSLFANLEPSPPVKPDDRPEENDLA